jgi:hypothetical protein
MVVCDCHPSYAEKVNRRITVQASLSKKGKILFETLKQNLLSVWLKW